MYYQTATELARLCLSGRDIPESASQHSDDNADEGEEQNELVSFSDDIKTRELASRKLVSVRRKIT